MRRVMVSGPGEQLSSPIPKTQKVVLDAALLNIQHYKVLIKGKVEQTTECSSYWKESLWSSFDYGRQLYLL